MLIFKVGYYLIAYVEPAVGSSIRIEYTCDQLPDIFVPVGYQGANLAKVAELLQAGGAQQTGKGASFLFQACRSTRSSSSASSEMK